MEDNGRIQPRIVHVQCEDVKVWDPQGEGLSKGIDRKIKKVTRREEQERR